MTFSELPQNLQQLKVQQQKAKTMVIVLLTVVIADPMMLSKQQMQREAIRVESLWLLSSFLLS